MSRKLTKSQKTKKRKQSANAKIRKMEIQDATGVSRKKLTKAMDPHVFMILKIISVVAIPVVYFAYSPLLMVCVIFSALTYVFAVMTERKINHTFIKANHMKILKLDSIIAILVILLTIAGVIIDLNTSKHMPSGNVLMTIRKSLENFGSCLTGNRSFIHKSMGMGFGTKDLPADMPSMGGKPPKMENLSVTDLPIEGVFSMMISSVTSVMLFMIPVTGIISIILYKRRKKRFDREMNEVIVMDANPLTEEEFNELFLFGYELNPEIKASEE